MFLLIILFLRIRRPPRSTRTDTLFPYTTLFRSGHQHILFLQSLEARGDDGFGVIAALPVLPRAPAEEQREREDCDKRGAERARSEEHTSELQSLMRIPYAVFCLNKKNTLKKTYRKQT